MSQNKLYLITSGIGIILLLIAYWIGIWPLAIMTFPLLWIGIYKLLLYFIKKRNSRGEPYNN